ncbi:sigma-70 family RNA polymerase sigma factor [Nannocystis sp. ILAH1]|uniref:RNA polymerase sigma factor n=1 Tax=Nannocystis sp. ILAH1 TaxID=2996789 RepID=UPI00226D6215|nr:sigma-70 family RNA polymerase sigma factor [Nannocystis sp. ILAH1]MCY0989319.1 sigma-70 family RNA polymerase sigma factor [Nannocystis sp. ILAH1]
MTTTPRSRPIDLLSEACACHEAYLRGRLRGLGVPEAGLDDAVQDVFEVLVRRIGAYDRRFSLRQWMAGVARKIARRHRERAQRAPGALEEAELPAPGLDPESWSSRQEALADLQAFLGELDPDRWAVFVLSEIEGLRGTEIAAELGVNLSTVYARLRVAKAGFERTMARRRGERRGAWLWLPLFGESSQRGSLALTTPLALVGVLTASAGGMWAVRGCVANDESESRGAAAGVGAEPASRMAGVPAREVDPAGTGALVNGGFGDGRAADNDGALVNDGFADGRAADRAGAFADDLFAGAGVGEAWIGGPSGSSSRGRGTWRWRMRYLLQGDEVVVEIAYAGDEAIAMDGGIGWVELEGLTRVEGPGSWPIALEAGERRVVRLRLRAGRDGVVDAVFGEGRQFGLANGGFGLRLMRDGGRLRRCGERECYRTAESIADELIGETVRVELHNRCSEDIEVAMMPCELEVPPADAPRLHLAADELRPITVDAGLCFGRVRDDGNVGSRGSGSDGFVITFSGAGCGTVAADSKQPLPGMKRGE